ncbi:MAG: LOG family protein, partial [Planctomycetota bacterium]
DHDNVITVFGGARASDEVLAVAERLGRGLAEAGFAVASGGYGGTMEAVSRGARRAGAHTIGVVAGALYGTRANEHVIETIDAGRWMPRMQKLIDLGTGYVALPGGTGTLAELAVVWEMIRKTLLPRRPMVCIGPTWKGVLESIDPSGQAEDGPVVGIRRYDGCIWTVPDPLSAVNLLCRQLNESKGANT